MNRMVSNSYGYNPADRINLMEAIVRLSLIEKKSLKIKRELKGLIEKYRERYGWIHEFP